MNDVLEFEKLGDDSILDDVVSDMLECLRNSNKDPLQQNDPFCLWLMGPMGAGKTTFSRYLLRKLGLPEIIPVTSPTFAYLNEYEIGTKLYMHMDLFRAGTDFDLEELGIDQDRPVDGLIVEWPEQVVTNHVLKPTHKLSIEFHDGIKNRKYRFFTVKT